MRLESATDTEYTAKALWILGSLGSHEQACPEWQPARQACLKFHLPPIPVVFAPKTPRILVDAVARATAAICPSAELTAPEIRSALMHFAHAISEQPQVAEAWSRSDGDLTTIWVLIDDDSIENRRQVFESEQNMMDKFPDLEFDFYVFSSACKATFARDQGDSEQFYVRT